MKSYLKIIGPGLLIAATGVGAGDLAGGAFAGSKLGMAVIWAVLLGALFKYVLTEGLARFQLATGKTLLEGLFEQYGKPVEILFFIYLIIWSFAVGSALISATGVAAHALYPVFESAENGKIFWGIIHSLIAMVLVWLGTYNSFEKLMNILVGLMFAAVIATAILIKPNLTEVLSGLIPSVPKYVNPDGDEQGVIWTLALMGGVGGTLTILSYGYWIKEKGRKGTAFLKECRIDLATAYIVTALFGVAMIIISSQIDLEKESSAKLIILLTEKLNLTIGNFGSSIFMIGAYAAVFTSLLGVWQSVPYMFADFWQMVVNKESGEIDLKGKPYRTYLVLIAVVPLVGLFYKFVAVQKAYAFFGSFVIPLIAAALLFLNSNKKIVGEEYRNKIYTTIFLILILLIFSGIALQ